MQASVYPASLVSRLDMLIPSTATSSGLSGTVLHKRNRMKECVDFGGVCYRAPDKLYSSNILSGNIGSLAPLVSVTVVRTISFSIYSKSKSLYAGMLKPVFGDKLISTPHAPFMPLNPMYWFMSGATAGGLITFIACELPGFLNPIPNCLKPSALPRPPAP
jgi:hypothetical protein